MISLIGWVVSDLGSVFYIAWGFFVQFWWGKCFSSMFLFWFLFKSQLLSLLLIYSLLLIKKECLYYNNLERHLQLYVCVS